MAGFGKSFSVSAKVGVTAVSTGGISYTPAAGKFARVRPILQNSTGAPAVYALAIDGIGIGFAAGLTTTAGFSVAAANVFTGDWIDLGPGQALSLTTTVNNVNNRVSIIGEEFANT